ncbi:MAG: IS110 family transposase [Bacilli bacterium]|nr:IS110 family transposase [Bacilli bacterium]
MFYSVGIDISMGKSTIAIISTDGEVISEPFEIEHTKSGFNLVLEKIKDIPKDNVKFVMESTGNYCKSLLKIIIDNGYFVTVENPLTIKKYCDINIRKVKTDKKDALKIACYGSERWHKLIRYTPSDEIYSELRFLSRQYDEQMSLKVMKKIHLSGLIEVTFPGLKKIFNGDSLYMLMLDIYKKYYHPSLVLSKSKSSFIKDVEKISKKTGHRIGMRVAEEMYSLANECIPSSPCNKSTQLAVSNCVLLLQNLEEITNNIIAKMDELARQLPEFETVSNMSGVGNKIRARLIAEIGDVRRFKNSNCLIAYAGIDVPPFQSGQFVATNRRITKRGNKHLRKVGYEAMKSLKTVKPTRDNAVYLFIVKKEDEGKGSITAKIAGLNKFLRIYYARVMEVYKNLENT